MKVANYRRERPHKTKRRERGGGLDSLSLDKWAVRILIYFSQDHEGKPIKGTPRDINKFFHGISANNVTQYEKSLAVMSHSQNGNPPFLIRLTDKEYVFNEKCDSINREEVRKLYSKHGEEFLFELYHYKMKMTWMGWNLYIARKLRET